MSKYWTFALVASLIVPFGVLAIHALASGYALLVQAFGGLLGHLFIGVCITNAIAFVRFWRIGER